MTSPIAVCTARSRQDALGFCTESNSHPDHRFDLLSWVAGTNALTSQAGHNSHELALWFKPVLRQATGVSASVRRGSSDRAWQKRGAYVADHNAGSWHIISYLLLGWGAGDPASVPCRQLLRPLIAEPGQAVPACCLSSVVLLGPLCALPAALQTALSAQAATSRLGSPYLGSTLQCIKQLYLRQEQHQYPAAEALPCVATFAQGLDHRPSQQGKELLPVSSEARFDVHVRSYDATTSLRSSRHAESQNPAWSAERGFATSQLKRAVSKQQHKAHAARTLTSVSQA